MIRWLFSKTVRDAGAMHKHVYRLLCAQRDLISQAAFQLVSASLVDLRKALHERESVGVIREKMWTCEEVANKWLKPYPNPLWRENVEIEHTSAKQIFCVIKKNFVSGTGRRACGTC